MTVDEPTIEQTVQILSTLSTRYTKHHGVDYSPEALESAAKLAERYLPDRFLPDKAIDLMDEAGALMQIAEFTGGPASGIVGVEQVAEVVSSWTGIPLSKLTADESAAMLDFEGNLHKRVIGQARVPLTSLPALTASHRLSPPLTAAGLCRLRHRPRLAPRSGGFALAAPPSGLDDLLRPDGCRQD